MKILRLFHFQGWLEYDSMSKEPEWLNIWTKAASRAKDANRKLLVFEVPAATSSDDIEYIEKYLQDKHQVK